MQEGWHGEDYLILYDKRESSAASERYGIAKSLPGFEILGFRGWDDFVVQDAVGAIFTVPTVPLDREFLEPFEVSLEGVRLESDPRFADKIKWYLQPTVFGGDPSLGENVSWISDEKHAQLVRWWNDQYDRLKSPSEE